MKIHLRADSANGHHTAFSVFVDGANAGRLTMRQSEASIFRGAVRSGLSEAFDSFSESGTWSVGSPWVDTPEEPK